MAAEEYSTIDLAVDDILSAATDAGVDIEWVEIERAKGERRGIRIPGVRDYIRTTLTVEVRGVDFTGHTVYRQYIETADTLRQCVARMVTLFADKRIPSA